MNGTTWGRPEYGWNGHFDPVTGAQRIQEQINFQPGIYGRNQDAGNPFLYNQHHGQQYSWAKCAPSGQAQPQMAARNSSPAVGYNTRPQGIPSANPVTGRMQPSPPLFRPPMYGATFHNADGNTHESMGTSPTPLQYEMYGAPMGTQQENFFGDIRHSWEYEEYDRRMCGSEAFRFRFL